MMWVRLVRMHSFKSSGFFVCLSAFLLVLGVFLVVLEVPVQVTHDPAAEQWDLMRAYAPFGFALCILALVFLAYGAVSGVREPSVVAQLKKPFLMASVVVGVVLGFLTMTSTFLPWVIVESIKPLIETRGGVFDVGQYHALTGINLMTSINSVVSDIILLAFAGSVISILHIPLLTLLEGKGTDFMRALLFLLSGTCIIWSVTSIYAHRTWWIYLRFDGALGFTATLESPGIGLLIAALCASGLIAFGIITAVKSAQQRLHDTS